MMNYFELYEIPVSFHPDKEIIKKKFYALSKTFHPDRFTLADEAAQQEALEKSSLNNQAYKTLINDYAILKYILELKGVLEAEEKYNLPPDFLMEMMELNETVSEYEMDEDAQKKQLAISSWQQQDNMLSKELGVLTEQYDETKDERLLIQIKE